MADYVLTCESVADLTEEHFASREIYPVAFHYAVDGVEYRDDFGKTMSYEEFYRKIDSGSDTRTAQVNISEYQEHWEPFLKAGKDVVHVAFSSGLSGTINSARNAAAICGDDYPERRIYVVDSLAASSGFGLLLDYAADMRDSGLTAEQLADWVEKNRLKLHHWFFSTDLSTYVKGGRISKTAAVFGGILQICPLLDMNNEGKLTPRDKIRTPKRVIREIVNRMKLHADGGADYSGKCYISYSLHAEDYARQVADLVEAEFPKLNGKVQLYWVGTTIGSHTGPGTVALYFMGDERIA